MVIKIKTEEEIKKSCKYANGQCLYDGNCPPFEGEFIWCRYLKKDIKPIEGGISICHDELPTSPEIKKR